jgi:hypothetical protein
VTTYWWVNQGNTWDFGGDFTFLWAALKDAGNATQPHWDALDDAVIGDIVIHYARQFVIAVSRVAAVSTPAVRPHEFETGARAGDMGRTVYLDEFQPFDIPVHRDDIPLHLRRTAPGTGGPFDSNGNVRNGYFFPLDLAVAVAVFTAAQLVVTATGVEADSYVGDRDRTDRELFLDLTGTDGVAVVKYRREQGGLRSALFGNQATYRCGLCARRYPVRYLRTAHIKSRWACSEPERKDWRNIVMAACVFGCDALFEDGMLRVDASGTISLAPGHGETATFAAFTTSLAGKTAPAFTEHNRAYFEWRNAESLADHGA